MSVKSNGSPDGSSSGGTGGTVVGAEGAADAADATGFPNGGGCSGGGAVGPLMIRGGPISSVAAGVTPGAIVSELALHEAPSLEERQEALSQQVFSHFFLEKHVSLN